MSKPTVEELTKKIDKLIEDYDFHGTLREELNPLMKDLIQAIREEERGKAREVNEALKGWADWWNGPGRRNYYGELLPPLTKTGNVLSCSICAGVLPLGETCQACGRHNEDIMGG